MNQHRAAARPPRLLMIVSEDWYFCSHRLSLAKAAQARGFEVAVATRPSDKTEMIRSAGLHLFPLHQPRTLRRPWQDARAVGALANIYRKWQPDLVHAVSVKTGLLAALVGRVTHRPATVLAFGGLGELLGILNRSGIKATAARHVLQRWLKIPRSRIIVQNPEDHSDLLSSGLASEKDLALIRGAGVCTTTFTPPVASPVGVPQVLMASRMLWSKGVGEFAEAAKILRRRGVAAQFVLAGRVDQVNRDHIPQQLLRQWSEAGLVQWQGESSRIAAMMSESTLFCLPSRYGEGVPKSLIEAASTGLPLITTDGRGCREVCRHEHNGLHVPAGQAEPLADAIEHLLSNRSLRTAYGLASRRIACQEFSESTVIDQTLSIYRDLLELPTDGAADVRTSEQRAA